LTVNFTYRLLEGVRSADSNNPLTFPARSVVSDSTAFQAPETRADYLVWVDGGAGALDIGNPTLTFVWTKNLSGFSRFDWDGFSGRWNTMPGSGEESIGTFGSGKVIRVPVPTDYPSPNATFGLYLGSPSRLVDFALDLVPTPDDFTVPPSGTVQISMSDGEVRFSTVDLANVVWQGQNVYIVRQSFFDRQSASGVLGKLPAVADSPYFMFLRPIPAVGQEPRIQIGNRAFLAPTMFPTESAMGAPTDSGAVHVALDTGRVLFAPSDTAANLGKAVYYRGISCGRTALTRLSLGQFPTTQIAPSPFGDRVEFLGVQNAARYVFFLESEDGKRYYYSTEISSAITPPAFVAPGTVVIQTLTGQFYISNYDASINFTGSLFAVDTYALIEDGVALQVSRSGGAVTGYSDPTDFKRMYSVEEQVQSSNLQGSPLFLLTTLPQEDDSQVFAVRPSSGSSGTFSGILKKAEDPTALGYGYKIDYSERSLLFTNRKALNTVLAKTDSFFQAPDPAILADGFQLSRSGVPLVQGRDFIVNMNGGTVEFTVPRGLSDPNTALGIRGNLGADKRVTFITAPPTMNLVGYYFAIYSGPNAGIYLVQSVGSNSVIIDIPNPVAGFVTGDLVPSAETLVNRVWATFAAVYKKFSIRSFTGLDSRVLGPAEFGILPTTGQVSLQTAMEPGQRLQVTYSYFPQDENSVSQAPVSIQEFAAFPVFQETATIDGFGKAHFNPLNRTLASITRAVVYVDGVSLDSFRLENNVIECGRTFTTENVTINYFVGEALGGETSFNTTFPMLDVDFPRIFSSTAANSGAHLILNGNVGWSAGTALLVQDASVFIVASCVYNSILDQSKVVFQNVPSEDLVNPTILYSQPLGPSDFSASAYAASPLVRGSREFVVQGNASGTFRQDMIVQTGDEFFLIAAVAYSAAKNSTTVTLASPAASNHIISSVLYSTLPVLRPTVSLSTSIALVGQVAPIVSRISSTDAMILKAGVDYNISEGGTIDLARPVAYGDTVRVMYLGRRQELVGTTFDVNYAYQVAPDANNGMLGQALLATYNLYCPDSFYFRVETVESYIPDVMEFIGQSSDTGTTSGPNVGNNFSSKMQSNGMASPYFEETRLSNMDYVVAQILLIYNNVVNGFEDYLSNLDGRQVGGADGKFRFDGVLDNPDRSSYTQVTNDIDDRIFISEPLTINFTTEPAGVSIQGGQIYKYMWETHADSRFFPTEKENAAIVFNDKTSFPFNYGNTLGNFGVTQLVSHTPLTSARSRVPFSKYGSAALLVTGASGNGDLKVPPLKAGQIMEIYTDEGLRIASGVFPSQMAVQITITGVTPFGLNSFLVTYTGELPIQYGSLLRSFDMEDPDNPNDVSTDMHIYGDDYVSFDHGDGSVHFTKHPEPFGPPGEVFGLQLYSSTIGFVNTDVEPRRPPVFDGGVLLDSGQVSEPLIQHENELRFLNEESRSYSNLASGTVSSPTVLSSPTYTGASFGQVFRFITGPNAGTLFAYVSPSGSNWNISPALTTTSSQLFHPVQTYPNPADSWAGLLRVAATNVESPPLNSFVGAIGSEIQSLERILESAGDVQFTSVSPGAVFGTTLTDTNVEFGVDADVQVGDFIWISDLSGYGIYRVTQVDPHILTISTEDPYVAFHTFGVFSYRVIRARSFFSEALFEQVARCVAFTLSGMNDIIAWSSSFSVSAPISDRQAAIANRIAGVYGIMAQIESMLRTSEALYESRFAWIVQRISRKEGFVSLGIQARIKRAETLLKIRTTQRKLRTLASL